MMILLDLNVHLERAGMLVGLSFRTANRDAARRCVACRRPARIHVFLAAFQVRERIPKTYSFSGDRKENCRWYTSEECGSCTVWHHRGLACPITANGISGLPLSEGMFAA